MVIRDYGGWVHYDFQESPLGSGTFNVSAQPKLPRWLALPNCKVDH